MVILVAGLPGAGKTYFAKRFATAISANYYSSDLLRKQLYSTREYSDQEKENVYLELEKRLLQALEEEKMVVIDATFIQAAQRARFREAAQKGHSKAVLIEVQANETTIRARLERPREDSEADFAVYQRLKELQAPITEPHLTLHSDDNDIEAMIATAKNWLGEQV